MRKKRANSGIWLQHQFLRSFLMFALYFNITTPQNLARKKPTHTNTHPVMKLFMNNQAKIIIVSLLLVNIVLLITLFLGKPNVNLRPQPKELIIKELGFKEAQVSDYEGVVEEHSKEVHALQNEIRNYKQEISMG